MLISVICPVLNEANNIQSLVDFFNYSKPASKEIIFVDGGSTDDTIGLIEKIMLINDRVRLLRNPDKYVSYALNLAIPKCKGEVIVRIDGHSHYSGDYFDRILQVFSESKADIVGGPTRTAYSSSTQEAIAFAISHPFGIGGSKVHDETYQGYTDSVTFGAWKRSVFEKTGLFDVQLIRNQDDEFHYRAKSMGLKIYQDPSIKLYYHPRNTFSTLFAQYFQYGLYKPLVLKKIKSEIKWRHLVPSMFFLYLIVCFLLAYFYWIIIIPLFVYIMLVITVSIKSDKSFLVKLKVMKALPIIHLSYGIGFLIGITKLTQ